MTFTMEQLLDTLKEKGVEVQWFPLKMVPADQRHPVTVGSQDLRPILQALNDLVAPALTAEQEALIDAAHETYAGLEGIAIDTDARFSEADGGTWVSGWLWIPKEGG